MRNVDLDSNNNNSTNNNNNINNLNINKFNNNQANPLNSFKCQNKNQMFKSSHEKNSE